LETPGSSKTEGADCTQILCLLTSFFGGLSKDNIGYFVTILTSLNLSGSMPTVRLDNEVFECLKRLAEPFVDSPNTVIRHLLVEKGLLQARPAKRQSAAPTPQAASGRRAALGLTPQQTYEQFLLATLERDFAGQGDKRGVTKAVLQRLVAQGHLSPADLELVATGETRAENTITWARNALKNRGLIKRGSRRGLWELTDEGREAASAVELTKIPRPSERAR